MKENRLTAPVVLGPSVFMKSALTYGGYQFDSSRYLVVLEQLISWIRLPFVWISWLIFSPSYAMTIGIDILIVMMYIVLNEVKSADIRNLELYAYDLFGTPCIVQNAKCPEFWMYYDSYTDSCKNFCQGEREVYGKATKTEVFDVTRFTCIPCPTGRQFDGANNRCIGCPEDELPDFVSRNDLGYCYWVDPMYQLLYTRHYEGIDFEEVADFTNTVG